MPPHANRERKRYEASCERQAQASRKAPYSCFPGKLGLAKSDWRQLNQVRVWFDTRYNREIRLMIDNDRVQPVQGNPASGYFFFDPVAHRVFFKTAGALTQSLERFQAFTPGQDSASFGASVSTILQGNNESQLLVLDAPYYYRLTGAPSGVINKRLFAVTSTSDTLTAPPAPASVTGLVPMQVVDGHDTRRLLRSGFYDGTTNVYIAYLSSLLDGGRRIDRNGDQPVQQIGNKIHKRLRLEHLPIHKVQRGQTAYYLMFSQHSGNLYYLSTDVPRGHRPGLRRLDSGFHLIRPKGEARPVSAMAHHRVFARVQAFSGSLLAETNDGLQLRIPDSAWGTTQKVSQNLSVEERLFDHWQVKETGQKVAKSTDKLHVHCFTPESGVVVESLDIGQAINAVFPEVIRRHSADTWTVASARAFITGLKRSLRGQVSQARLQFSATVGWVPLTTATPVTDHPLLSAIKRLDLWYLPGSDTLLGANPDERFKLIGNDGGQPVALSSTRTREGFLFYRKPREKPQGERAGWHPFCGTATGASLNDVPAAFNGLISIPCRYPLHDNVQLAGHYRWDQGHQAWHIKSRGVKYRANQKHLAVTELDLSVLGSRRSPLSVGNRGQLTYRDYSQAMGAILPRVSLRQLRTDTDLITLKLRPGYARTRVAWVDYPNRKLLFGLPTAASSDDQRLIGGEPGGNAQPAPPPWNRWYRRPTSSVVYDPDSKKLTRVSELGNRLLGSFEWVEVMPRGLLLTGTPNAERFDLKALRLDTYYRDGKIVFDQRRTGRPPFSVIMEGNGGADRFEVRAADMRFFKRIVIHPGVAGQAVGHPRATLRLRSPAYLYAAQRQGQDVLLFNRFDRTAGAIQIQHVWAQPLDRPLQPMRLVFDGLRLSLSALAQQVARHPSGVVFPLNVDRWSHRRDRPFIRATADNPLYVQLGNGTQTLSRQAMNGINLVFYPEHTPAHERPRQQRVFITHGGHRGWAPGSVQVRQPEAGSHYQPLPFIPALISSSATGNHTEPVRGNARNNVLYIGTNVRQWSVPGRQGNDLLLLGTPEDRVAQANATASPVPFLKGDRCDDRQQYLPAHGDRWPVLMDRIRTLAGGEGDDVYDLRASRLARVVDDHGQHYILLSSRSKADLRKLSGKNSTALFFTDLTPDQIRLSGCDPKSQGAPGGHLTNSGNLTNSNSTATPQVPDRRTVKVINVHTNQTLALLNPEALASVHFKGGQVSLNPLAGLAQNGSVQGADDSDQGALAFLNKIIARGQRLVNYFTRLIDDGSEGHEGNPSHGNHAVGTLNDTELNRHYQRLVQDISALAGNRSGESPSFMPSPSQGMAQNLTTPQPVKTMAMG